MILSTNPALPAYYFNNRVSVQKEIIERFLKANLMGYFKVAFQQKKMDNQSKRRSCLFTFE